MNSVTQNDENSNAVGARIANYFRRFRVCEILKAFNVYKEQGVPVLTVLLYLFQLVFRNRSMYLDMRVSNEVGFAKDTVYRLKNSIRINWTRLTTMIAAAVIKDAMEPLTSESRKSAFTVNDIDNCLIADKKYT